MRLLVYNILCEVNLLRETQKGLRHNARSMQFTTHMKHKEFRNSNNLLVLRFARSWTQRCFLYRSLREVISLPHEIKIIRNFNVLKSKLKNHYCSE